MIHSFLLIGQSNMAGRGAIDEVPPINSKGIVLLKNGIWRPSFVPYHWDTDTAGICLAESFADAYRNDHPDVQVGLIPCAEGNTCLDQWMPGEPLYESALLQAKFAKETSQVKAILWHQGEADCKSNRFPLYEEKCTKILNSLRNDLDLDIPVIVGGLGEFLADCPLDKELANYIYVNAALAALATNNQSIGYVPSFGLSANDDLLHYNAASLRKFGLRYYEVYKKMIKEMSL